jgi:hypothetical protein
VGVVLHGMTHQAVADHFNVSRITISGLMIRLRQTGRTNDRHRSGSAHVTSQRQDRHLRLIHLRNRMITAEDTARRTPSLANVPISDKIIRRRLRESVLRARLPVVGPLLQQRRRIGRLWRIHTWQHILSFLVMNPDFHFVLAMDIIVCTAGVGNVLRTSVCTSLSVLESEVLWFGLEFVMMVALSSKLFKED